MKNDKVQDDNLNTSISTAHVLYETTRAEILMHISHRNKIIFWYLIVLTTVIGLGFEIQSFHLLLLIPLISFGSVLLTIQHDMHIGALANYCSNELNQTLSKSKVTVWDNSNAWIAIYPKLRYFRLLTHVTLIALPSILSVLYIYLFHIDEIIKYSYIGIWQIINVLLSLYTLNLIFWAQKFRKKIESVSNKSKEGSCDS